MPDDNRSEPLAVDLIRLGQLLTLNIAANRKLAEQNRKAAREMRRVLDLAARGITDFGERANTDILDYKALSLRAVARELRIDVNALRLSMGHLDSAFDCRVTVGDANGRTGQLTDKGWELAVVGVMLDRAFSLINDTSIPASARQRVLFRMIYRLNQDIAMETSSYSVQKAEENPQPFSWLGELVAPPDHFEDENVRAEHYEAEDEFQRQLENEELQLPLDEEPYEPPLPERI